MKQNEFKFFIYVAVLIIFCGCIKSKTENDFVYDDGINKIEFIIADGKNYLIKNKPTKARFIYSDGLIFSVSGPGIKVIKPSKNTMNVEITTIDGTLVDSELKVVINAINGDDSFKYNFGIPVKTP